LDLLQKIGEHLDKLGVQYEFKIGSGILPVDEYMHKLDASSIYICTSFQEGGPLPAMDAMARGCIVLTTPVGQMLELIKNGVNGFFCSTESEFVDKINLLMHESECFEKMRLNAIQTIRRERSEDIISEQVAAFLKSVID
jgi:glycosyltransferase involved in cell wall biosynthesis